MKLSVFYEHIAEACIQKNMALSDMLSFVGNLGIEAVDIDSRRLTEAPALAEQLSMAELKISSVYQFFDFGHTYKETEMRAFIDLAKRVGAKIVLCIPGFFKTGDDKEVCIANMVKALTKMCAYANTQGITVTLEDFDGPGAPFSTIEELLYFMRQVPGLRYTYDTGNFLYSEQDELQAFAELKDYIVHVHLKDRSLLPTAESATITTKGRSLYPSAVGSGCIHISEIIRLLKAQDYQGYYAIEHFGARDQLEYIQKSVEYLGGME